ncbi:MAG: hypothetical protein KDB62_05775 [Solirubrobacterales bacterium]|nr:hypothetical protein [Solirubrobacterales bacterium]
MPAEIGASELTLVLILLCVVVVPIATIAFARSGKGLENIGKGPWAIDREEPRKPGEPLGAVDPGEREAEVRQLVEAADFRRRSRGEPELDVEAETNRLLGAGPHNAHREAGRSTAMGPTGAEIRVGREVAPEQSSGVGGKQSSEAGGDQSSEVGEAGMAGVRDEIRELVVANNERRERRGEPPLDVDSEVERRLRDWA